MGTNNVYENLIDFTYNAGVKAGTAGMFISSLSSNDDGFLYSLAVAAIPTLAKLGYDTFNTKKGLKDRVSNLEESLIE